MPGSAVCPTPGRIPQSACGRRSTVETAPAHCRSVGGGCLRRRHSRRGGRESHARSTVCPSRPRLRVTDVVPAAPVRTAPRSLKATRGGSRLTTRRMLHLTCGALGREAADLLPGRHDRRVLRSPALAENPSHGTQAEGTLTQRRGEPEGRAGLAPCRGVAGCGFIGVARRSAGERAGQVGAQVAPGEVPPGLMCSSPGDPRSVYAALKSLAFGVRRRRRHRLTVGPGASRIWSTSSWVRWPVTLDAANTEVPEQPDLLR